MASPKLHFTPANFSALGHVYMVCSASYQLSLVCRPYPQPLEIKSLKSLHILIRTCVKVAPLSDSYGWGCGHGYGRCKHALMLYIICNLFCMHHVIFLLAAPRFLATLNLLYCVRYWPLIIALKYDKSCKDWLDKSWHETRSAQAFGLCAQYVHWSASGDAADLVKLQHFTAILMLFIEVVVYVLFSLMYE